MAGPESVPKGSAVPLKKMLQERKGIASSRYKRLDEFIRKTGGIFPVVQTVLRNMWYRR
jgi:hypothetical protein